MITIATSAINATNSFELSQKRYADSIKNYVTNWTQNSTSSISFSNVLQDARNGLTEVNSGAGHIQIQPLDATLSSGSISAPFHANNTSSMPASGTSNSSSVTQSNTTSDSTSSTEDSVTQNTDLKDQATAVAKVGNSTKNNAITETNLYSYLTGEKSPSEEDKVKVDSILNRLSTLTSTQGNSFTSSNILSSLQGITGSTGLSENSLSALTALNSGVSGNSLSSLAALNGESSIQALLKSVYGNSAYNNSLNL